MRELLVKAILSQDFEEFKRLFAIAEDSEFENQSVLEQTLLHVAARVSSTKICELLITKMSGKAINVIDDQGRTALTWAAVQGNSGICKLLTPVMSFDAINTIDYKKHTALIWAIKNEMNDTSKHLIFWSNQQTLNNLTKVHATSLSEAIRKDMILVSKMLIPLTSVEAIKASKIYSHDYYGYKTLLEYTEQYNKPNLYKMLFAKVHSSYLEAFGNTDKPGSTDLVESTKNLYFS
jgi:ankyrin repeat protein